MTGLIAVVVMEHLLAAWVLWLWLTPRAVKGRPVALSTTSAPSVAQTGTQPPPLSPEQVRESVRSTMMATNVTFRDLSRSQQDRVIERVEAEARSRLGRVG